MRVDKSSWKFAELLILINVHPGLLTSLIPVIYVCQWRCGPQEYREISRSAPKKSAIVDAIGRVPAGVEFILHSADITLLILRLVKFHTFG